MKRLTHSLGLCVLLAACGGGGGGNGGGNNNGDGGGGGGGGAACTPASDRLEITTNNATGVSAEAYDATVGIPLIAVTDYVLFLGFLNVTSTQSTDALLEALPRIGQGGIFKKQSFNHKLMSGPNLNSMALPDAVTGRTLSCPAGGSYTLEYNDADNSNSYSNGDIITFNFSNCQIGSSTRSTVNGQLITRLDSVTNNSLLLAPFRMTFNYNRFIVQATNSAGTTTSQLDGDMTATYSCPTDNCRILETPVLYTKAEGNNLTVATTEVSGKSYSSQVRNYVTQMNGDTNSRESSFSGNGTLYIDTSGRAVSFETTSSNPFKARLDDNYPYAGEQVSTGACNSKVKLDVIDNRNVTVAVDADGDGVYESTNSMTWDNLTQQEQ